MWAARIGLFAVVILGLSACTSGGETPPSAPSQPPSPPSESSLGSAATIERIIGPLTPTEARELDLAPSPVKPVAVQPPPAAAGPGKTKPSAPQPAAKVIQPVHAIPPAAIAAAPKPAEPPAAAATLDLDALKMQLKETKAIGIFTKISLKNQVDDLMGKFRKYYKGDAKSKAKITLADLRQSYNLLMMKVLSLTQKDDPALATAIVSSRDAIWELLADPEKFATFDV